MAFTSHAALIATYDFNGDFTPTLAGLPDFAGGSISNLGTNMNLAAAATPAAGEYVLNATSFLVARGNVNGAIWGGVGSAAATAATNTGVISFTLSAPAGFDLTFNNIVANSLNGSGGYTGTTPNGANTNLTPMYSVNGSTYANLGPSFFIPAGTSASVRVTFNTTVGTSTHNVDSFAVNGTLSAVPEPSSIALLSLGALGLLRRRR